MKRNRLTLQKVDEVSLVDRGDNPAAHVLIHKREGGAPAPAPSAAPQSSLRRFGGVIAATVAKLLGKSEDEVQKAYDEATTFGELQAQRGMQRAVSEAYDYGWQLQDAIASTLRDLDEPDREAKIRTSIAEFSAAVETALPKWVNGETVQKAAAGICPKCEKKVGEDGTCPECGDTIEKAGRKISAARLTRLKEAHSALGSIITEADTDNQDDEDMSTTKQADTATPPAPAAAATGDDVLKNLPAEVRKAIEDANKRAEEANARAEEALAKAAQAEENARVAVLTKRVQEGGDLAGLPGMSPELVPTLKALQEKAPEEFAKLETVLTGAAEAIRSGDLMKELGANGGVQGSGSYAKLQAKAAEIRKAEPNLTEAQALVKAQEQNPDLVAAVREEGF